jgi:hypothetical protein
MADDQEKKKDEVVRLLSDVESQAERVEALGQDIARSARLARDVVGPVRDIIRNTPVEALSKEALDRQAETWRAWQSVAGKIEQARTNVGSLTALSVASTSTSTGMIAMVSSTPVWSAPLPADVEAAKRRLHQTLERFPLAEQAQSLMQRLGLDRRSGSRRAPLELLAEARGALDVPAFTHGGPTSVLIPLRECIEAAIAELLRRRPTQEPAGKAQEKLRSIGRQCHRDGLDAAYFERLALESEALLDDLSGAKQAAVPRERVIERFHRGLLFLNSVMGGIDENRLRSA